MTSSQFLSIFAQKESQRFKLKVGVFLFLIQDGHILLLRRYRTGIDDGMYVVPMGGHDGLEPLTNSIIREANEEANITLQPEQLQVCHVMHRFHPMPDNLSFEQIDIFFKAESYAGVIENMEPHKCDELEFYSLNALPEKTVGFIRHAIECMRQGQCYSEFGWENHR
jgi:8-oxo-dGTP pyrophosphatase MutT (NUDIX family)